MIESLIDSINKERDDLRLKELKISERKLELDGIVAALNHIKPHVTALERELKEARERVSELEAKLTSLDHIDQPSAKGD